MLPRAAPRAMKTASPLGQGGLQRGFGTVTDKLAWVVDPETHPGASRPLSLRATPPRKGIFQRRSSLERQHCSKTCSI